jgi:hypothetical protein
MKETRDGLQLVELAPGVTLEEVRAKTEPDFGVRPYLSGTATSLRERRIPRWCGLQSQSSVVFYPNGDVEWRSLDPR